MPDQKDMLVEAYRIQVERWNKRRDLEWRVNRMFWGVILVITLSLAGKYQFTGWTSVIHGVLFVIYLLWVRGLWLRNAEDKYWMYSYQEKINTILCIGDKCDELDKGISPNKPLKWWKNYCKVWMDWSPRSQLLFTFFMLVCSFLTLYFSANLGSSLFSFLVNIFVKRL